MIQTVIVGVIVALAFVYVLRKYLPAALRQRLVHFLTRRGAKQSKVAEWLDTSSSCSSGCDSCRKCEPSDPQDAPKQRVIPIRPA
ncbi:MAG TPA: DUF6587 family protein [Telluria sp.]|nr:DUF6587 family protein [Telluria sp.]